ncbi:dTMP kinase [Candidatus Symbiobacter mobilis]|uniref:Thymidylate kinase n=1 Tax=Candidatus Symbiobacter mobilis CR TaxID=946483 RepID=U5N727_9BURK|nr:dTMP kinase [Candidatus Symbiobacter mobilis]AGX87192.1 thymidylate kinase [Candidatus Symbiobacter mobilis CR]
MRGLFLSVEGIDGAGKSTHIDALAQAFVARGRSVVCTREPGGTPLAERLRALVLHEDMDATTEALLVFAARRDHLQRVIEPALQRGEVVLCDRFTDASFAYQGFAKGLDLDVLATLERIVQGLPGPRLLQPDLTLWFDLDPEVAAQRLAGVRVPDRFESQPMAFHALVVEGYRWRRDRDPARFVTIDAGQPQQVVCEQVLQALVARGVLA